MKTKRLMGAFLALFALVVAGMASASIAPEASPPQVDAWVILEDTPVVDATEGIVLVSAVTVEQDQKFAIVKEATAEKCVGTIAAFGLEVSAKASDAEVHRACQFA